SAFITAGAGSVILLWGTAGDLVVELEHLKPPAEPVGPFKITHDHDAGVSTIEHGPVDVLGMLRHTPGGLTVADLSRAMFGSKPTANEKKQAERKLKRLVTIGLAYQSDQFRDDDTGAWGPARYFAAAPLTDGEGA